MRKPVLNTGACVQHRLPIAVVAAAAFTHELGISWARSASPLCPHSKPRKPPWGACPGFSSWCSWVATFPELVELCGKGWEALRCPNYYLLFSRVPGLSSPSQGTLIIDCCFWSDGEECKFTAWCCPSAKGWIFLLPLRDGTCWQESYKAAGEELHATFSCLQPSLALFLPRAVGQTLLWQVPVPWPRYLQGQWVSTSSQELLLLFCPNQATDPQLAPVFSLVCP